MKLAKKLSPAVLEAAKPEADPYRIWDTVVPQMHLRVQPSGVKSFNVTWARNKTLSLGKWPAITVESARTKAREALADADRKGAPKAVLEARKGATERPITLAGFLTDHYGPWATAHHKAAGATLAGIRSTFAELLERDLRKLSAFDIERVKAHRLKAGRKPATVNRDLDRIRGALSRAVDWGFLAGHPMKSVKRAKGADNSRVRYLTGPEEKRLRDALAKRERQRRKERASYNAWAGKRGKPGRPMWPVDAFTDHVAPLVLLAMNTGLRRGELFGISWSDVNLPGKLLTVPAGIAKSRKARHVPLNAEAADVLGRWKPADADGLVFPSAEGGRMNNITKAWAGLVVAAKLQDFRFHDLRHHFASRLVMAGVDLNTVRELLGHKDIAMTLRYSHLAPDKLADAVAKLEARK